MTASTSAARRDRLASFTLIELLFVMAIITLLVGLLLYAANGVMTKSKRGRALSEIQAMSTALEGYKTDNGIFPSSDGVLLTNTPYTLYDGTSVNYQTNSTLLFIALSGQTNFSAPPISGAKSYMSFRQNQVGTLAGYSYVKDPWGYSYGYSTGTTNGASTTNLPYNGGGFFDLWSTGGLIGGAQTNTAVWIANWQ
jgi:type II secretory pathway pseudopilin PulG